MGDYGNLGFILAALPIIIFLILSVCWRITLAKASFISLLLAIGTGSWYFGQSGSSLFEGVQKGAWNTFSIYLVVLSTMLLYGVLEYSGMFEKIPQKIEEYIADELLQVLFVGWILTSFLQSVTGFGVPVAVAAPILVKLGVTPVKAVTISVLGHAWGGTFGTLALAWEGMLLQLPEGAVVDLAATAFYTCLMLGLFNLLCGLAIVFVYRGPRRLQARELLMVLLLSLGHGGGQLFFATLMPTTACFAATLLTTMLFFPLQSLLYGRRPGPEKNRDNRPDKSLGQVVFPFCCLTVLVVTLLMVEPINGWLRQVIIGWPLKDAVSGTWQLYSPLPVLAHSFSVLLLTALLTYWFYRREQVLGKGLFRTLSQQALRKSSRAILPVLFLVIMSKVMEGSGQIDALATGAAALAGHHYSFFAPFIGMLGAFISSSNMSSNILFTGFQYKISQLVMGSSEVILAAQTAGGSVGILTAAGNLVLGLATAGEPGKEGLVMQKLLPFGLAAGAILGMVTVMFSR